MENQYVIHQLESVAYATSQIEQYNNAVKDALCVLIGYFKADEQFNHEQGGAYDQLNYIEAKISEVLEFTQKEISKMPKQFRTLFKTNGIRAHVRKRIRNNSVSYEIRFRADGYNISASATTLNEAKLKFIQKLHDIQNGIRPVTPDIPKSFGSFVTYYFEKFRKRKVNPDTYKKDVIRMKKHILPVFGNLPIKAISPPMCQQLIDSISATGHGRTVEEVFSLLNGTFKIAIKHNLIQHNPLDIVVHDRHEREHGKALTIEEEHLLLQSTSEPYRTVFAVALFTGLRPNEYKTVQIKDGMIHARNSKRHNGKEETKRIPITPMLKPYISDSFIMPKMNLDRLRKELKTVFGEKHKLYDLRTTFFTRCKMCDVAVAARDEFMGHNSGEIDKAYTDLPDDYLIKEGQKLDY